MNGIAVRILLGLLASVSVAWATVPEPADGTPVRGLWWNPDRPGAGFDLHRTPGTLDYVLVWYGHDETGNSVWYLGSATLADDQLTFDVQRFRWDSASSTALGEAVGTLGLHFSSHASATLSWDLPGRIGAEPAEPFVFDAMLPAQTRSGLWADLDEPGWGLSIATQGAWTLAIHYHFDEAGAPRWVIGQSREAVAPLTMLRIAAPDGSGAVVGSGGSELELSFASDGTLDALGDLDAWPIAANLSRLTDPLFHDGRPGQTASDVAFVDVAILSMADTEMRRNQTLTTREGLIRSIGPSAEAVLAQGTTLIRAPGRWLMPGLVDAHVHLVESAEHVENDLFTILANGVTTVRQMWGQAGMRELRDAIDAGDLIGPRILTASPGIEGPQSYWPQTLIVANPTQARAAVRGAVQDGFDFIKVYSRLSRENYDAIVREADAAGVAVVGHVSGQVGIDRALTGQRSIEHLMGYAGRVTESGLASWAAPLSTERVREMAAASAAAGVWNVPTQVVIARATTDIPRITGSRDWRLLSPAYRSWFLDPLTQPGGRSNISLVNRAFMIRALWEAGAPLAVGTDSGVQYVLPGPSMHEEMASFRAAGIPAIDMLMAATRNGAELMGRANEFGTLQPGLSADLLLLADDPRSDPSILSRPLGVMARGRWWSRAAIDTRLDEIEASYLTVH